jgi:hypothetical protein
LRMFAAGSFWSGCLTLFGFAAVAPRPVIEMAADNEPWPVRRRCGGRTAYL